MVHICSNNINYWLMVVDITTCSSKVLPLREYGDELVSNFFQLLKLYCEDDKKTAIWLERKIDRFVAPVMQNEILKIMALQLVAGSLQLSLF